MAESEYETFGVSSSGDYCEESLPPLGSLVEEYMAVRESHGRAVSDMHTMARRLDELRGLIRRQAPGGFIHHGGRLFEVCPGGLEEREVHNA